MSRVSSEFFLQDAVSLARGLLGACLYLDGVGGMIVETEAYTRDDPASHSFRGKTQRNAAMFGPAGHAYIYRSYGLHWCFNIVCGQEEGSAVLIRALEPRHRMDVMAERRGLIDAARLCAGPGRLTQALAISSEHNALALSQAPFVLTTGEPPGSIITGPRIGIRHGQDLPWRFGINGSPFLSRRFTA